MNILITNDDGVHAEGIQTLADALSEKYEVYIIAPNAEKSACSNAITVRRAVKIKKIREKVFSIDGYPADCVNIGLHGNVIPPVDLVVSGINHGPNLGDDIHFSGTVAGARTALVFGLTGIGVSLDCVGSSLYFADAARFVAEFIGRHEEELCSNPAFLNINYPDIEKSECSGVRYAGLGKREYRDSYRVLEDADGEMSLQLIGTIHSDSEEGTDIEAVKNGYISITPLKLDSTDYDAVKKPSSVVDIWLK